MAYNKSFFLLISLSFFLFCTHTHAETIEYDLTIMQQQINITGTTVPAMTINGSNCTNSCTQ
jgi:hypothetical protein